MKRQPAGIPVGGQFAADRKSEPTGTLSGWDEGETLAAPEQRSADHVLSLMSPANQRMESAALESCTPEGRELYLQKLELQHDRNTRYSVSEVTCDRLAASGFTNIRALIDGPMDPSVVAYWRMPLNRYDFLSSHGGGLWHRHANGQNWITPNGDSWSNTALLQGDENELKRVFDSGLAPDSWDGYAALVTVGQPERTSRLEQARDLGITSPSYIESKLDLDAIKGIMDEMHNPARSAPYQVLKLAKDGHSGASIRKFGATAAERFTAADLEASGVPAKKIRSFVARGGLRSLSEMRSFHDAEFAKGDDVMRAKRIFGEQAQPKDMAEAMTKVSLVDLSAWQWKQPRQSTGSLSPLSRDDVDKIVLMQERGTGPHKLG